MRERERKRKRENCETQIGLHSTKLRFSLNSSEKFTEDTCVCVCVCECV